MRNSMNPLAILAVAATLVAGAWGSNVGAATTLPVENLRSLLVAAIDSPTGEASAELSGEMISAISARFKASGPLRAQVTTLRRLKQPGCSRLNVRLSQTGVQLPDAPSPQLRTLDIGMNYCRDGSAPVSAD